jgi:hypothetical protein
MTSHKGTIERGRSDELDKVLRWTLHSNLGQAQPPAHVWGDIERKVRRRAVRESGWYALARASNEIRRRMLHSLLGMTIGYPDLATSRHTTSFGGWADYAPLSLVCIFEPQMSLLKLGLAT